MEVTVYGEDFVFKKSADVIDIEEGVILFKNKIKLGALAKLTSCYKLKEGDSVEWHYD